VRKGKSSEATALATSIGDPVAQKLVEWALLRSESGAGFERYAAFIRANPHWPSIPLLRRRAEARLWQERRDAATVRRFLDGEPTSATGRFALSRVLMGEGDRAGAEREIRVAWQSAELPAETEAAALDEFRDVLTRADHTARMDRRIGAKDFGAAMRAAKRLGSNEVAIVKACAAAEANATKGGELLDAVPAEARGDLGYALCRLHWLLRHDGVAAAVKLARPHCRVYGVEPEGADSMYRSFAAGSPQSIDAVRTIADSLGAPHAAPYSFSLCRRYVDDLVLVSDDALRRAMLLLFASAKLAVEPAGAAATAALVGPLRERLQGRRVGLIVCGANIDAATFSDHLAAASGVPGPTGAAAPASR